MKKNSKILFFQPNNNYSGSCRVLLTTIQDSYKDCDYKVVTMGRDGFLSQLSPERVVFLKYPLFFGKIVHGPSYLLHCIKLFFVALLWGFSYRHFYINTIMPFPAALAGRLIGCKITYHIHEKFINPDIRERTAAWVMTHIKAKRIYVSRYLKESYNDNRLNSEVRYNKLSRDFINDIEIVPIEKRKRNTLILVSAIASRKKGVDLYYKLAEICPEYRFLLVTGTPVEETMHFLDNKILSNLFIYQGGENVSSYLKQSDLLINLSNPQLFKETFGMTILEGMAYGLPTIVPNAGGPIELVEDGVNGYKVDVTDVYGIKYLIDKILDKNNYKLFCENTLMVFRRMNA